jgi:putative chitinase
MNTSNLSKKLNTSVLLEISEISDKFGINTPLRLAHFLSQCSHESGNFTIVKENLNYSAERLRKVFPKYFPTDEIANQYSRQPEKIANKVYANKMGNGDEASGDGYKFRGRGYIQLTGHDNYKAFGDFIGEDCVNNPDLVATKYPLASAAYFFQKNKLWDICDKGSLDPIVAKLTERVNGGNNGYADRLEKFKLYNSLLS